MKGILISENQNSFQHTLSNGEKLNNVTSVVCYVKDKTVRPKIGSVIKVSGTIKNFERATNPGQFDMALYYKIRGYDFMLTKATIEAYGETYSLIREGLYCLRERLEASLDRYFNPEHSGILKAMLLGDKDYLSEDIRDIFEKCGCSHLLVISGTHIGIIGLFCFKFLKRVIANWYVAAVIAIGFISLYGIMCGSNASTLRAIIMFSVCVAGYAMGRTYDMATALALAALITLMANPMLIYDSGYLLSFGAVMGIALGKPAFQKIINEIKERRKWKKIWGCSNIFLKNTFKGLGDSLIISISISVFTLPITLFYFYRYSVYSIFLNLILIPLAGILIICGISCAILGLWSTSDIYGGGLAVVCKWIMNFYINICRFVARIPGNIYVTGKLDKYKLIIYYILLAMVLYVIYTGRKKYAFVMLLGILMVVNSRTDSFKLLMLDVGQGDGIMLYDRRNAVLVDGGSSDVKNVGKYRIKPAILASGIRDIDYIFMTHMDNDHINGLVELLQKTALSDRASLEQEGVKIHHVVMSCQAAESEKGRCIKKLCENSNIDFIPMEAGQKIQVGHMMFKCIYPFKNTQGDSNELSMVFSFTYGSLKGLLTGDMEGPAEDVVTAWLCKQGTSYDFYKVSHHGSKNSSKEPLLKAMGARLAFISCGQNNSYGHPHEETLVRLKNSGSDIFVTMDSGAIELYLKDNKIRIIEYCKGVT